MKLVWSTSIALFAGMALMACSDKSSGNTTETTNAISGIIEDKDGKALANNPVFLRRIDTSKVIKETLEISTNDKGEFEQEVDKGKWSIEAYNSDSTQGFIQSEEFNSTTDLGTINLLPTMSLIGNVENTYTIVKLHENQRSTIVNNAGDFAFAQLPRGTYEITMEGDEGTIVDTLDLTYAPDSLMVDWIDEESPNLKYDDSTTATLRAYWNLDSNTLDQGPDLIHGYLAGNLDYNSGVVNRGAKFIAHTHMHFDTKKPLLEVGEDQDFGFSLWLNIEPNELQNRFSVLSMAPSEAEGLGLDLIIDAEEELIILNQFNFGGQIDTLIRAPFDFEYNRWFHLSLYRQQNLYGVEVDRNIVEQYFASNAPSYEGSWLLFGADYLFKHFYKNMMDEIYYFNSAPTSTQLDSLYDLGK